jgi:hypothetical protein
MFWWGLLVGVSVFLLWEVGANVMRVRRRRRDPVVRTFTTVVVRLRDVTRPFGLHEVGLVRFAAHSDGHVEIDEFHGVQIDGAVLRDKGRAEIYVRIPPAPGDIS